LLIVAAFASAAQSLIAPAAHARDGTAYRVIQEAPISQLTTLKGSLTFLGISISHPPEPILFGGPGAELSQEYLDPSYDPGLVDLSPRETFRASEAELHAMLDSIATVAALTDELQDDRPLLSLVLAITVKGKPKRFEAVLNTTNTRLLLGRMRGALRSNAEADRVLADLACGFGMLTEATPVEATSQLAIKYDDGRHADRSRELSTRVRLTNMSDQAIRAPIYLVIALKGSGVRVTNLSGYTCQPLRMGAPPVLLGTPYIRLPVTLALAPSGTIECLVDFHVDDFQPVEFVARVFSGSGDP
jgi:hypothetical protein